MKLTLFSLCLASLFACVCRPLLAAENLRLRPGISYYQDIDNGFPILGDKMDDITLDPAKPTFIFFGVSGDLNTNRQAKRVIDLYKRFKEDIKFVVIDVDNLSTPEAKALAKTYYTGYIPEQVLIDSGGEKRFDQVGEIEVNALSQRIVKLLKHK